MGELFDFTTKNWDGILSALAILFWVYVLTKAVVRMFRDFREINGSEATLHEGVKISSQKFYSRIESAIGDRQLNDIRLGRRYYKEHMGISHKREYLAISYNKLLYLVCAAPYGTGYFISTWSGEKMSFLKELTFSIPRFGPKLVEIFFRKTFFELDTEAMFRETVKGCVREAEAEMITNKGKRDHNMGIPNVIKHDVEVES
ncbi:MAG TPA: hypothetical protein VFW78_11775 [Bacteroidia bacterium]|nr:hypothetical protein [Bacteroidia bacterium]